MGRKSLLGAVWLLIAALAACAPAANVPATAGVLAATAVGGDAQARILQPTAIPSVTPLGSGGVNQWPYGSVQINAQGQLAPTAAVSAPLFSAQSSINSITAEPNVTAPPLIITTAPVVVTPMPPSGGVTVPLIGDNTGGFVISVLNSLCIPVINFLLSVTIGLVQSIWNAVGLQMGPTAQVLLCILLPIGLGWYFLAFRRRRRR